MNRKLFAGPRAVGSMLQGVVLRGGPDGQAEGDLVHKIREVVDEVQGGRLDAPHEVAEEVARGVDRPADGDDEAHGREGGLHVLVRHARADGAGLALEDLEEDEGPAAQAQTEAELR